MDRKNKSKQTRKAGDGPRLSAAGAPRPKSGAAKVSPKRDAMRRPPAKRPLTAAKSPGHVAWYKRRKFWSWAASTGFMLLFLFIAMVLYFAHDLPSINGLESLDRKPGITMKSADGEVTLASYGDVYGDYVAYEAIPEHLVQAVLATEDRRFFSHSGIDVMGIARAMVVNIRAGRFVQGGSTITQQVAKNLFLTPDRTLKRKFQEMLLAFWLEGRFSKEQILAIYLNRVYLGAGNYGIDAASRRYFDKPATDITLMESAVLTGLLKAPSRYSPLASLERAKNRAHQVLLNMVDADYLSAEQVNAALESFEPPKLYREGDANGSRYFTDWLVDEIPLYLGQVDQDITVITTLDPRMQREAEDAVSAVMDEHAQEKQAEQAAVLAMDVDGAIRAMVGGRSYLKSQFNRVTQAERQPGSVFKIFVYLAALEAGMTPDILIEDAPLEIPDNRRIWRPTNFDGKYAGEITMREALTRSVNTVAVQLALAVGLEQVVDMARRLGMTGIPLNPSIALGAVDANLLDLTTAYAHLANKGRGVQPYGIVAIYSQGGDALYRRSGSGLWVVLRDHIVNQMLDMLQNVPLYGTGRGAYIGRPMAGKTGTSSDFKDAWFIGFTPQLVTGVWVGNDDNTKMKKVTGGNLPAMIWKAFMTKAVEGTPALAFATGTPSIDSALPWQGESQTLNEFEQRDSAVQDNAPPRGATLEPSFWDTLFGGDDSRGGRIEHEYPTSSPRERSLNR